MHYRNFPVNFPPCSSFDDHFSCRCHRRCHVGKISVHRTDALQTRFPPVLSPGQQLLPTTCRRRSVDTAGPRTTVGARPFLRLWPPAARADGNALLPVQPGPSGQRLQPLVVAPHKHQKGHRERIDGWAPMAAGTSIATDHEFDLKCHVGLA